MKAIEIEAWALRVLDSVQNGSFVEDSLVELKSEWPDARKAARQIAGHANAARGTHILWLIGVDERLGIKGVNFSEISNWWQQIEAEFDGVAPSLDHLNVASAGKIIAALCFDTERAPFVVKNRAFNTSAGGAVELEVPWREGTRTRSATRADLIRVLAPLRLRPSLEVLRGRLQIFQVVKKEGDELQLSANVEFYVAPQDERIIVFPFHKFSAKTFSLDPVAEFIFGEPRFRSASKQEGSLSLSRLLSRQIENPSVTVHARLEPLEVTASEVIIRGPGKLIVYADAPLADRSIEAIARLRLEISLVAAQGDMTCGFSCVFGRGQTTEGSLATWELVNA